MASSTPAPMKIYFAAESDKFTEPIHFYKATELRDKLRELVDDNEEIRNVRIYWHPIYEWQLTALFMYHPFVVLETNQWWWSLEKTSEGVTIQRSKLKEHVINHYRQKNRSSRVRIQTMDDGTLKMNDFIHELYLSGELNKSYDFLGANGEDFAKRAFEQFSKQKGVEQPA